MARSAQSQWDFGEQPTPAAPAPVAEVRKVWSVGEFTQRIKRAVERDFSTVWVSGEVSNLRSQPSGHLYFVLKDAQAQLNCVLFRGQAAPDRQQLRDGVQVTLGGDLTVYESRGQYQLRVTHFELQGAGALHAAFERLKARLTAEGLFDPGRKRPIPRYPRRLGIVTSSSAAALRDVLHVLSRRAGGMEVVLAACRVQGRGAEVEIAVALNRLNAWSSSHEPLDVILVTRGGGSLEDLWCFNEEVVARAIVRSQVPVISAVGHEIDFTIADFAADLRAATPSAAAELLTEGYMAAAESVTRAGRRLQQWTRNQIQLRQSGVSAAVRRLNRGHPQRAVEAQGQALDDLRERLKLAASRALEDRRSELEGWVRRSLAVRPRALMNRVRDRLADLRRRQSAASAAVLGAHRSNLRRLNDSLRILSPDQVLERGYSITLDTQTGNVIRRAESLAPGQRLRTRLARGTFESTVAVTQSDSAA